MDTFYLDKGAVQVIPTAEIANVIDLDKHCVDAADYEYYLNETAIHTIM